MKCNVIPFWEQARRSHSGIRRTAARALWRLCPLVQNREVAVVSEQSIATFAGQLACAIFSSTRSSIADEAAGNDNPVLQQSSAMDEIGRPLRPS